MIVIDEINKKIKAVRTGKKITLKTISEKTDLSISFLSQVERGVSSLTITSLKKIADALGVGLDELISYEDQSNFVHKRDNPVYLPLHNNYSSHQIVSGKFIGRKLECIIYTIEPNSNAIAFAHEGEEFHYVIQGSAIFYIDNLQYELEEGETIHFPSTLKHKIDNAGEKDLKVLSVLTPTLF